MEANLAGKCASLRGMVSFFLTLNQRRTASSAEGKGLGCVSGLFSKKGLLQALMATLWDQERGLFPKKAREGQPGR